MPERGRTRIDGLRGDFEMRRLIICCDGTWNTADQHKDGTPTPTNVAKLHSLVAARDAAGIEQLGYYRTGVGTSGGIFRRMLGGAIGLRLEDDIMSAYKFLADLCARRRDLSVRLQPRRLHRAQPCRHGVQRRACRSASGPPVAL